MERPRCGENLAGGRFTLASSEFEPRPHATPKAYYPGGIDPFERLARAMNDPFQDLAGAMTQEFDCIRSNDAQFEERLQQRLEKIESCLNSVVEMLKNQPTGAENKGIEEKPDATALSSNRRPQMSVLLPYDLAKSGLSKAGSTGGDTKMKHVLNYAQNIEKRTLKRQCNRSLNGVASGSASASDSFSCRAAKKPSEQETRALKALKAQGGLNKDKGPELDYKSFLAPIVGHPYFDSLIATVVLMNSVLVGLQINYDAVRHKEYEPYTYLEYGCAGFFSIELLMRILVMKADFCHPAMRFWSAFDFILVIVSWLDVGLKLATNGDSLPGPGAQTAKILKMARMARILRVLRMVKFLAKVRIMSTMILGSMASLFWLFVLIVGLMYVFALVLTQGCADWIRPFKDLGPLGHESYDDMKDRFGTVPRSMYTLFLAMTSGVSWGEPAKLTQEISAIHWLVFSFFVFFTFFSVLNIVTGVFVDGAIQQANNDRSIRLMQQHAENREFIDSLLDLLNLLDEDQSGFITHQEWQVVTSDEDVHAHMNILGVNADDADKLFKLLDTGGDGVISIDEFVQGMSRLRGPASSLDLHVLMSRVNFLIAETEHFFASHLRRFSMQEIEQCIERSLQVQYAGSKSASYVCQKSVVSLPSNQKGNGVVQ